MKRWLVKVSAVAYVTTQVEVEAGSAHEAGKEAVAQLGDSEWKYEGLVDWLPDCEDQKFLPEIDWIRNLEGAK